MQVIADTWWPTSLDGPTPAEAASLWIDRIVY